MPSNLSQRNNGVSRITRISELISVIVHIANAGFLPSDGCPRPNGSPNHGLIVFRTSSRED